MTEDDYLKAIGKNITSIRKKRDLTSKELALRCFMEKSNMIAIEKGRRNVSAKILLKIAIQLKCEVKDFFEF